MNKYRFLTLFIFITFQYTILSAQSTIKGKITDNQGEELIGANIIIKNATVGTTTDVNGEFLLETKTVVPFVILISYAGYQEQEYTITEPNSNLKIVLEKGLLLDDIVISASRKREKIQEAPASMFVLNSRQLAVSPDIDPTRTLGNYAGVTIQQQSAGRINIELRGSTSNFNSSVLPIMDYRNLVGAGIGAYQPSGAGISTIDLDRIEVVRGPGSALYGAGVTSGVIHYITKNPIDHPGTTVEILGGELNTFGFAGRYATKVNDKFGFKINALLRRGGEFTLDPDDPDDAIQIAKLQNTIVRPTIFNGRPDPYAPPQEVLIENLDEDGDGNPMANDYENWTINTTLEFRPQDDFNISLSGGLIKDRVLFWNNQGEGLSHNLEYWTQARAQYKGLFAQVFYSNNNGGFGKNSPALIYQTGLQAGLKRQVLESQIQYNFEIPSTKIEITTGFDTRQVFSETRNTTYGRNEENDDYSIIGGYLQNKIALSSKLDFLLAARYDNFNFLNEGFFSPRVALVFKPLPNHTIRASYNLAGAPPTAVNMYLDIPGPPIVPNLLDIWISGQIKTQTFSENSTIDVTIPGVPDLPLGIAGMPLAIPYNAVTPTLLEAFAPLLADDPLGIGNFLASYQPNATTGNLVGFNLFDRQPLEAKSNEPIGIEEIATLELGYTGFIKDKLRVNLDIYRNTITGARNFTALSPVYALVGADSGGGLAAEIRTDLTNYLANFGLPAEQIESIVAPIVGAYAAAGAAFDDPITGVGGLYPLFGSPEGDNEVVPGDDDIVHVASGLRVVDGKITYVGMDFSTDYYFTPSLIGNFNYSWVSQNEWSPEEDDISAPYTLNTPKDKWRVGIKYLPTKGFNGSLTFQHTPSYNMTAGQFSGITDEQNLVDLSLGYGFNNGLRIALNANNLFNNEYRYSPNFPKIGRIMLGKLTYNFGGRG